jgi:hypothetical protein
MRLHRRELLVTAAGLAGSLVLAPTLRAAPLPGFEPSMRLVALFDARYSDARKFAAAMERSGAPVLPAHSDVARLWYGALRARAFEGRLQIAGLTTYADFAVMRGSAAEAKMKVAFQAVHDARRATSVAHRIDHARGLPEIEDRLARAGDDWPTVLALALCGKAPQGIASAPSTAASRARDNPGGLFSWLIV